MRRLLLPVLSCVLFALPAVPGIAGPVGDRPAEPEVGRADLAECYMRFEQAMAEHPPPEHMLPDLNRAFDGLTIAFFTGQFGTACAALDRMTLQVEEAAGLEPDAARGMAFALQVRPDPKVAWRGNADDARLVLWCRGPVTMPDGGATLEIVLRAGDGRVLDRVEMDVAGGVVQPRRIVNVAPDLVLGDAPQLVTVEVEGVLKAWWPVVERPLDDERRRLEDRLAAVAEGLRGEGDPDMAAALAACRARVAWLADDPSLSSPPTFLFQPLDYVRRVRAEVAALEAGRDPYHRMTGDLWRTIAHPERPSDADSALDARVYVPPDLDPRKPAPLVVALHGAGGDENLFFNAYGAGLLKDLAARHGFVVVSPRTEQLMGEPALWDAILDTADHHHPVDRRRVHVLGHSLGAMTATALAQGPARDAASVVGIAGGGGARSPCPPLRIYGADLDLVVPARGLRAACERAAEAGLPVEYRHAEGWGHTLVVPHLLPDAVEWLLAHRRY